MKVNGYPISMHTRLIHLTDTKLYKYYAGYHEDTTYAFTYNNIITTHVLLETVRHCGRVTMFIHLSSDEVYGKLASPASGVCIL